MRSFEDKVCLVTGAASGIGRATALAFAREGAKVVVSDVSPEGEQTVAMIRARGGGGIFARCDVSDPAEVESLVTATMRAYGRIDCAFNNAGIEGARAPILEYPDEAWNRVLSVNLTGVWLCMKHELREMARAGSGAIVNNASILGVVGFAGSPAYTAAKHGVIGLTKVAALELAPKGIRVNAVCPGFIETPMLARAGITSDEKMKQAVTALEPIGRMGKPEEIAEAVLWLCSPAASFVTGHAMLVDGGYVAQ